MVRSASPLIGLGLACLLLLGGCADSTQRKSERAELAAKREVASRKAQQVTQPSPDVHVRNVALVRDRRSTAIVVDLQSSATKPLTDVPIAVGVRRPGGARRALNAQPGLGWFQTHVPAIPAGGRATWVFHTKRATAKRSQPFATVGAQTSPALSRASTLPAIEVSPAPGSAGRTARVRVENASAIPQSALQVYAVASAGGRYVAAGTGGARAPRSRGERDRARSPDRSPRRTADPISGVPDDLRMRTDRWP